MYYEHPQCVALSNDIPGYKNSIPEHNPEIIDELLFGQAMLFFFLSISDIQSFGR